MQNKIAVPFDKLRKVIHLADVHIRLFKRHQEFKDVFESLYRDIIDSGVEDSVIVVAGDIVHSKTDLSPEMVSLASEFLDNLARIAPTLVIAGNHDMNQANVNRLDALSPICDNIKNSNLHYLKNSGVYDVADAQFAVLSLIGTQEEWPKAETMWSNKKIALFHGPVHNASTDVGYVVTNRHITIETFDGFDMVMLGDIHKHQTLQERTAGKPIIVYPGSLVQQNHGELPKGHGWCEWDLETESFKFHEVHNTVGYYTLRVENGIIPDYSDMQENVRLRIFTGGMDETEIKKLVTSIRSKHTILECAVTNYSGNRKANLTDVGNTILDIQDVNFQNKLIGDFLKETQPDISTEILERVLDLNKTLNENIGTDDLARKITWIPKSLKFDNLFTYGEGNSINFEDLNGVAGIFAPNASGKTSIAEAICFALYDRTPRTTKASSIMNYRKDSCFCEFIFEIEGVQFIITRKGKKNKKGEVKIDVNFERVEKDGSRTSLNGEERRYTNNNIKSYVGEYDDFVLTTLSSSAQTGLFVDRGQADRKDVLSQFMGLTIFDKLHGAALEESVETAAELKRFKNDDFTQDLVNIQTTIKDKEVQYESQSGTLAQFNQEIEVVGEEIQKLYAEKVPVNIDESVTIEELKTRRQTNREQLEKIFTESQKIKAQIDAHNFNIAGLEKKKSDPRFENLADRYSEFTDIEAELSRAKSDQYPVGNQLKTERNRLEDLSKHEFDPECDFCVMNGEATIKAIEKSKSRIEEFETKLTNLASSAEALNKLRQELLFVLDDKELFTGYERQIREEQSQLQINELRLQKMETLSKSVELSMYKAEIDISDRERLQESIIKNRKLDVEIAQVESRKRAIKVNADQVSRAVQQLRTDIAVLKQKRQQMLDRIEEAKTLESKYAVYKAYLATVCRDGLPYKLIAEVLPEVEVAVNNLLSQMVEFTLKFEMLDGKNVNMRLAYDDTRIWPLELASGMEKFISGLAIRVALMGVSSLPKSNFLIIDEGLGALDPDNLSSMYGLFDVLRTQFEFIMVISHVDTVRDVSDRILEIKRNDGFSRIEVA
jgi:DNA repair exonuclease SbcCD ATPase subunit/DNA repair exonuclease SbcCD nuclease subunit